MLALMVHLTLFVLTIFALYNTIMMSYHIWKDNDEELARKYSMRLAGTAVAFCAFFVGSVLLSYVSFILELASDAFNG